MKQRLYTAGTTPKQRLWAFSGASTTNILRYYAFSDDSWTTITGMTGTPTTRQFGGMCIYNNRIIIYGGYTTVAVGDVVVYDIATKTWTNGTAGIATYCHASTIDDSGRLWAFGGTTTGVETTANNTLRYYDITANTWTTVTGASGTAPTRRYFSTMVYYDNKLYIYGGVTTTGQSGLFIYNILTNTWSAGAASTHVRYGHSAGKDSEGNMWVFGGFTGSADSNTLQRYSFATNTWTTITTATGSIPTARRYHTMGVFGNTLVVYGGTGDVGGATGSVHLYNSSTNSWITGTAGISTGGANFATEG